MFHTYVLLLYTAIMKGGTRFNNKLIMCINLDMFVVCSLILLSSYLRMNGKLTEELLETFLGLSSGLLPVKNAYSMSNTHIMVGLHCHCMPKWLCTEWCSSKRLC